MNPISWTRNKIQKNLGVFIMAKLTIEDKIKIIELYKEGFGYEIIGRKFGVHRTIVQKIIRQHNLFGDISLNVSHTKRKYTPIFKMELIKRVLNGASIWQVATENMISTGQLGNWIKKYKELGYNGLIEQKKGRPPKIMKPEIKKITQIPEDEKDKRIRELEERNAQLEMENDLLKKLRALVQQRTQQPNKKK